MWRYPPLKSFSFLAALVMSGFLLQSCETPPAKKAFPKAYSEIEAHRKSGSRVIDPKPLTMTKPVYPDTFGSGTVQYVLEIGPSGEVRDIRILSDAPESYLEAIRKVVRQWRFSPGTVNGVPATFAKAGTIRFVGSAKTQSTTDGVKVEAELTIMRTLFPENWKEWTTAKAEGARVKFPKSLKMVRPKYPAQPAEGQVYVAFIIDEAGWARNIHIIGQCPKHFQDSLREAVTQWQFEPGTINGQKRPAPMALSAKFDVVPQWVVPR